MTKDELDKLIAQKLEGYSFLVLSVLKDSTIAEADRRRKAEQDANAEAMEFLQTGVQTLFDFKKLPLVGRWRR